MQVLFLSASDEINKHPDEYWTLVMDIARRNSLARIRRCGTIMGRGEEEELSAAQIMYPCMQCADIFYLKVFSPYKLVSAIHKLNNQTGLPSFFSFGLWSHRFGC